MKRTALAHWQGNLTEGKGTLSSQSGILAKTNYSFKTRFEEGNKGTNPEELLAAAHAGCFTMAVSAILTQKGFSPTALDTEATVTIQGLAIIAIHLSITGLVTGLSPEDFLASTREAE